MFFWCCQVKGVENCSIKESRFCKKKKKKISLVSRFFSKSGDVAKRLSQSSPHRAYCFTSCFGAGHVWRLWRRMKTCRGSKVFSKGGWGVDGEADEVIWHHPLCLTLSRQSTCLSHCTIGRRGLWFGLRWTWEGSGTKSCKNECLYYLLLCSTQSYVFQDFISHLSLEPLFSGVR